jgi:hypothetical protein
MGTFRERTLIYLGLRGQLRVTKPKIGSFLIAGVFFGAVMGVKMQWFSGHGFSGWGAIYALIFGIVVFGPVNGQLKVPAGGQLKVPTPCG